MIKLPIVSFLGKTHGRKKKHFHLKMSTICFLKEESETRVLLINLSAPHPKQTNKQKKPLLKYLFQFKSTGRHYGVMPGSLVAQGRDVGVIPGLGRVPGEGNGNPLQCSCLQNPMDGGAWQATVHRPKRN